MKTLAMLLMLVLGACAYDKGPPLNITELQRNQNRCKAPEYVFDSFRKSVEATNLNVMVEVIEGDKAQIFIAALNATPKASNFIGERVAIFIKPSSLVAVTVIDRFGCVIFADSRVPHAIVAQWRLGMVPPIPSGFHRHPKTKEAQEA